VEGSFAQWSEGLRRHLLDQYSLPDGLKPIPEDEVLPSRWSLEPALKLLPKPLSNGTAPHVNGQSHQGVENRPSDLLLPVTGAWTATVSEMKRLTPESHWQDVRLVGFDIPPRDGPDGPQLRCFPGDCLTIYPKNFSQDAQKLITLMGWDDIADQTLDLTACDSLPRGLHALRSTTLRDLLLNNIDITAIPRRSFLKSMSYFTSDPYHKERLLEFTETQYLDEYFDYATRSRRTIIEVLEEFTSVRIPAERLLDIFPLIRGRDFSIANGGAHLVHPTAPGVTRVELLVALVRYQTVLRKPREGLCSRYLASLSLGCTINVTHKPVLSAIHGQENARRPLVAMATGTGVAPVRCLIQERLTHPSPGPMLLFFGNRNRAADYFFEDEWAALAGSVDISTAFSRDQRLKVYVQDKIREEASRIADLIPRNAIFTVCGGSSKMADACKAAVFDPFVEHGGPEDEEDARKKTLDSVTWWQEIW
jgi:sulfite reductase alpha subunit-like flavoprotein